MQLSWTDIAVVLGALALIVLVIWLVYLIKKVVDTISQIQSTLLPQVQSTMAAIQKAVDAHTKLTESIESMLNNELSSVIKNIDRISSDLHDITDDIKGKLKQTQGLFDTAIETCETATAILGVARSSLTGLAAHISGVTTGIKTSIEFLTKNFIKKRRQL